MAAGSSHCQQQGRTLLLAGHRRSRQLLQGACIRASGAALSRFPPHPCCSNGGVFGSVLSTPIINPPQSAILGMHATNMRPWVVNGQIVPR